MSYCISVLQRCKSIHLHYHLWIALMDKVANFIGTSKSTAHNMSTLYVLEKSVTWQSNKQLASVYNLMGYVQKMRTAISDCWCMPSCMTIAIIGAAQATISNKFRYMRKRKHTLKVSQRAFVDVICVQMTGIIFGKVTGWCTFVLLWSGFLKWHDTYSGVWERGEH